MRITRAVGLLSVALHASGPASAAPPNAEPDRGLLRLEAPLDRSVFLTGAGPQPPRACITDVNALGDPLLPLLGGDRFLLALPDGSASFAPARAVDVVRSGATPSLDAADFTCVASPASVEVENLGDARAFAPEDRFCIALTGETALATSCAVDFRLVPRGPRLPPHRPSGVHRIASAQSPAASPIDVVHPDSSHSGQSHPVAEGVRSGRGASLSRGDPGPTGA